MGSEYFINSQELENKVRQLLPSQGGGGAGFDLSASTQIVPIIDLTESASGSSLREDLQVASSLSTTNVTAENTTTTITTTTGFFKLHIAYVLNSLSAANQVKIQLTDGAVTKDLFLAGATTTSAQGPQFGNKEMIVFVNSGNTLQCVSTTTSCFISVSSHQVASIAGNLTNPLGFV